MSFIDLAARYFTKWLALFSKEDRYPLPAADDRTEGQIIPKHITEAQDQLVQVDLRTGRQMPVSKTDSGKLWAIIASGTCPDCGKNKGFYEGPSGGMSINIECAACGNRFNVTPVVGIAERI